MCIYRKTKKNPSRILAIFLSLSILLSTPHSAFSFEGNLQPEFLFSRNDAAMALTGKYFFTFLGKIEKDPSNMNVPIIKERIERELDRLKRSNGPLKAGIQEIVKIKGAGIGAFILNCGEYKIRYFNPYGDGTIVNPGDSYKVVETSRLAKYLSRQVIRQIEIPFLNDKDLPVKTFKKVNIFKHVEKTTRYLDRVSPYVEEIRAYLKSLKDIGILEGFYINGSFALEDIFPERRNREIEFVLALNKEQQNPSVVDDINGIFIWQSRQASRALRKKVKFRLATDPSGRVYKIKDKLRLKRTKRVYPAAVNGSDEKENVLIDITSMDTLGGDICGRLYKSIFFKFGEKYRKAYWSGALDRISNDVSLIFPIPAPAGFSENEFDAIFDETVEKVLSDMKDNELILNLYRYMLTVRFSCGRVLKHLRIYHYAENEEYIYMLQKMIGFYPERFSPGKVLSSKDYHFILNKMKREDLTSYGSRIKLDIKYLHDNIIYMKVLLRGMRQNIKYMERHYLKETLLIEGIKEFADSMLSMYKVKADKALSKILDKKEPVDIEDIKEYLTFLGDFGSNLAKEIDNLKGMINILDLPSNQKEVYLENAENIRGKLEHYLNMFNRIGQFVQGDRPAGIRVISEMFKQLVINEDSAVEYPRINWVGKISPGSNARTYCKVGSKNRVRVYLGLDAPYTPDFTDSENERSDFVGKFLVARMVVKRYDPEKRRVNTVTEFIKMDYIGVGQNNSKDYIFEGVFEPEETGIFNITAEAGVKSYIDQKDEDAAWVPAINLNATEETPEGETVFIVDERHPSFMDITLKKEEDHQARLYADELSIEFENRNISILNSAYDVDSDNVYSVRCLQDVKLILLGQTNEYPGASPEAYYLAIVQGDKIIGYGTAEQAVGSLGLIAFRIFNEYRNQGDNSKKIFMTFLSAVNKIFEEIDKFKMSFCQINTPEAIQSGAVAFYVGLGFQFKDRQIQEAWENKYKERIASGDRLSKEEILELVDGNILGDFSLDDPGKERVWDEIEIVDNAENVIGRLVEALMTAGSVSPDNRLEDSGIDDREKRKKEKVLVYIDEGLMDMNVKNMAREVGRLIKVFSDLENNNRQLSEFLKSVEIVSGKVKEFHAKRGRIEDGNIIVITKTSNRQHFKNVKVLAALNNLKNEDGDNFPKKAYLPVIETTLFAVGKYLLAKGVEGIDEKTLRGWYKMIPNAMPESGLDPGQAEDLFGGGLNFIVPLLPRAYIFDKEEDFIEMMGRLRMFMRQA